MASYSKLTDIFSIQSQLDCALEDATTQQEKENLVHQYLHNIDEKEDLIIPDFEDGKRVNELSGDDMSGDDTYSSSYRYLYLMGVDLKQPSHRSIDLWC